MRTIQRLCENQSWRFGAFKVLGIKVLQKYQVLPISSENQCQKEIPEAAYQVYFSIHHNQLHKLINNNIVKIS